MIRMSNILKSRGTGVPPVSGRHASACLPFLLLASCLLLLASCATPPGEIFPHLANAPKWPPPPDAPRIFYVGQLATSNDLKPGVNGFDALGQAIFGKVDNHGMLSPFAITTDNRSRLFVADSNAQLVHVFDTQTRKYATWTPGKKHAAFAQPVGIAWLSDLTAPPPKPADPQPGKLFVADSVAGTIFVFNEKGQFLTELGAGILQRPVGIVADAAHNRLLIADVKAHQIIALSLDGQLLQRIGSRGTALGQFNFPTNVTLDNTGQLFVSDSLNFRVQVFSPELKPLRQIGKKGDMPGYFAQPKGVATDAQGHLYVLDSQFENVQVFSPEGQILMDFGEEGIGPGQFWLPTAIFIDTNDRIWVADSYNKRIQVFDYKTPAPETQPTTQPTTQPAPTQEAKP